MRDSDRPGGSPRGLFHANPTQPGPAQASESADSESARPAVALRGCACRAGAVAVSRTRMLAAAALSALHVPKFEAPT